MRPYKQLNENNCKAFPQNITIGIHPKNTTEKMQNLLQALLKICNLR